MRKPGIVIFISSFLCASAMGSAQELDAKVNINTSQVENTKKEVFEKLKTTITDFLNNHKWTELSFKDGEKIQCNFNITVNTYSPTDNSFTCTLLMTSTRPVYNSSYTTTAYAINDEAFNFTFNEFDQLEYQPGQISNNLVALLSYYAYMIIGMDMDTMSPMGGTDFFHTAEDIVSAGDGLGFPGWKAFGDNKNRFALLHDYIDGSMEPLRTFNYVYHRKGLDVMAEAPDSARAAILSGLELLEEAHNAKNMTHVVLLFTEYKRDELVNIFSGKGTSEEKEKAYEILFGIDASQNAKWEKIKKGKS